MRTGTGGLKDGTGPVLIICNSQGEGEGLMRQYRAVDQDADRFDIIPDLASAEVAAGAYGAGTKWCVAGDTPLWFSEGVRARFNSTFGAQSHTSQAFATFTDEYAIDPKRLGIPPT